MPCPQTCPQTQYTHTQHACANQHGRAGIWKVYEATLDAPLTGKAAAAAARRFASGSMLLTGDRAPLLPAALRVPAGGDGGVVEVALAEGRYHQVRRMLAAVGREVVALHRRSVGGLTLGGLAEGEWRFATADDIALVFGGGGGAGDDPLMRGGDVGGGDGDGDGGVGGREAGSSSGRAARIEQGEVEDEDGGDQEGDEEEEDDDGGEPADALEAAAARRRYREALRRRQRRAAMRRDVASVLGESGEGGRRR